MLLGVQMVFAGTANVHFVFPEEATESEKPAFEVWINDVMQSEKNTKEVSITDIPTPICRLKILLSNKGQTEKILQNVYLQPNTSYTYHIAKNKTGNFGLFYHKESPITSNQNKKAVVSYKGSSNGENAARPAASKPNHLKFFSVPDLSPTPLCMTPLKDTEIVNLKASLTKEEFENRKLQAAKRLISGKCLEFKQLKSLMEVFEFEKSKLDLAKFGYHYVQDIDNHLVVQDTFEFGESNQDWQEYVAFLKSYR